MDRFIKSKEVCEELKVHPRTLYQWEEKGWIETIRSKGGMRLYNIDKYKREININKKEIKIYEEISENEIKDKMNIIYVRVSSNSQKDDLERQEQELSNKYKNHIVIKDIGSGINLNRKGLRKIIDLAIKGKINEVVIAYKDRLTRFGFHLIEDIIKTYSGGKIVVEHYNEDMTPEEEMVKDVLQIMNVFTAKMNGLRKYKKDEKIKITTEL